MSNDNDDVAILAAMTNKGLRNLFLAPGANPHELGGIKPSKMVDWRQFATNNSQPPPQIQSPSTSYGYDLPDPTQVGSKPLIPVPIGRDEHGNIIMGNPLEALQPPSPPPLIPQQTLQTTGFQLPQFGNTPQSTSKSGEDDSKFDVILKELKSLKKAINKLIRIQEQSKLTLTTDSKEIENTDKSQNID